MRLYDILKRLRLDRILGPGWPDHARFLVQKPTLVELTRDVPMQGRCLNAGCGEGLYLPFLEALVGISQIANVDITVQGQVLSSNDGRRHLLASASLTHLPFAAASFESCLCTEVIEHIPDDGLAVSELARVMKPGGVLLLSVPQIPAPPDPAHARQGYTFESMTRLLSQNGFTILERRNCMHAFARLMMWLWRHPLVVFGRHRTPYLPNALLVSLSIADRHFPIGKPWDLVVLARRED
jgi:SAM-dependent methyltransferase